MSLVIDAEKLVKDKKELPTEAFFIDTNIIIDFKDPFGFSTTNNQVEKRTQLIQEILHDIRSRLQIDIYSTRSIALEYYKFIQNNTVRIYKDIKKQPELDSQDLKDLRNSDPHFRAEWELRMKEFLKVFRKTFPIYDEKILGSKVLSDFDFEKMDFGDHLLYKTVISCNKSMRCIFSNDQDFYNTSNDIHLLTINKKVIQTAKMENKLVSI